MKAKLILFFCVIVLSVVGIIGYIRVFVPTDYIRNANYPAGGPSNCYYISISKDGQLKAIVGTIRTFNIKNNYFMREIEEKKTIQIAVEEWNELKKLIKQIEPTKEFKYYDRDGGREIQVLIDNKAYKFYEYEYKDSKLYELINRAFELSSIQSTPIPYY